MLVNSRAQSVVTPAETKQQVAGEDSDEEDEQYTAADTYTNYKPAKCKNLHSSLLFSEMVIVMGKECIVLVWCIYCS